jgi:hypothetical protein
MKYSNTANSENAEKPNITTRAINYYHCHTELKSLHITSFSISTNLISYQMANKTLGNTIRGMGVTVKYLQRGSPLKLLKGPIKIKPVYLHGNTEPLTTSSTCQTVKS